MDKLSQDINRLENNVARYIYIKYIQDKTIELSNATQESSDATTDANSKVKVVRPKVLDKFAYTIYRKNIFYQSRNCFALNQNDLIQEDIRIMKLADKAYEKHPANFKVLDFDLLPDVLRCSFIRKHHHRYYRCKNHIMNNDIDICKNMKTVKIYTMIIIISC